MPKKQRRQPCQRHPLKAAIAYKAKQGGLFLLVDGLRWDFIDAETAAVLVTWWADSGKLDAPRFGTLGYVRNPDAAVRVAINRLRRGEALTTG